MYSTNTSNFFESNQKGEIYELRKDLNSVDRGIIKNAVKKIIEMMSLGEDLSQLFPDVIKSLSTKDLELKKLVYLYTIHYAHKQPEKAILVVNTFQKDAKSHPNPLMRALAIRTMGCINVEKITEHLCDPLSDALSDSDPYVRKTAVICVAKLFKINEEMVIEKGFLDRLHLCLSDSNPVVVSNAVAAIENIAKKRPSILSKISPSNCRQLVSAINECTEWGQVYILEILAICFNKISDPVFVLERIAPRLSHSNPAVVLSAVKLVTILAKGLKNKENVFLEKIRPSLITLLCSKSELQYIVLKNLKILLKAHPNFLKDYTRVLFCKYNDPPYIKSEKIDLLVLIADSSNAEQILLEFNDYSREVDVDLARLGIRAIGKVALRLPSKLNQCINVLRSLLTLKRNHIANEISVVLKQIFDAFPDYRRLNVVEELAENPELIDRSDSTEAFIWLLGALHGKLKIDVLEALKYYFEGFQESEDGVRDQLLSAAVKCYVAEPTGERKQLCEAALSAAENFERSIDLNEQAAFYKRVLNLGADDAKRIMSQPNLNFAKTTEKNSQLFEETAKLENIGQISSIFGGHFQNFSSSQKTKLNLSLLQKMLNKQTTTKNGKIKALKLYNEKMMKVNSEKKDLFEDDLEDEKEKIKDVFKDDFAHEEDVDEAEDIVKDETAADLISFDSFPNNVSKKKREKAVKGENMTDLIDLFGTENEIFAAAAKTFKFKEMVKGDKGEGLQIFAKLKVHKAKKIFVFKFKNISKITLEKIYLTFDKNFLGLVPAKDFELKDELRPGSEQQIEMVVKKNFGDGIDENRDGNGDGDKSVQIGLKTDLSPSIKYFKFPFDDAEIEALIK